MYDIHIDFKFSGFHIQKVKFLKLNYLNIYLTQYTWNFVITTWS